YAHLAPALASMTGPRAATMVPSTTPVALGSFGTGQMPGTHGLVGASFWVPEFEGVLIPLHWSTGMPPLAVQPDATMFERMAAAGIVVTTIAPGAYRNSGLTRAVLRGGSYEAAEDVMQRIAGVLYATSHVQPTFSYVYWAELDRVGHEFGVGSSRWRQALIRVDSLVEGLRNALPGSSTLVVTADHGMVNCQTRIAVDDDLAFTDGVRLLAGEPRARHVYVESGQADQVAQRWQEALGEHARVIHKDELIASCLMGEVIDDIADRIGDLVVLANADVALTSLIDVRVSSLAGQHGAITMDEWEIPCLITQV
ncbi:MAG: nucleotide pyrophosphatase/phosphodiesterase family protein, partial [Candidatus Nanopelagicales bacterium]